MKKGSLIAVLVICIISYALNRDSSLRILHTIQTGLVFYMIYSAFDNLILSLNNKEVSRKYTTKLMMIHILIGISFIVTTYIEKGTVLKVGNLVWVIVISCAIYALYQIKTGAYNSVKSQTKEEVYRQGIGLVVFMFLCPIIACIILILSVRGY